MQEVSKISRSYDVFSAKRNVGGRLKLKCDNVFPCKTCVKRGCPSICPDGSLTAGRGNRMVLANTAELHTRIEVLQQRVRELEDALRILHTNYQGSAAQEHPLLSEAMLAIKMGAGVANSAAGGSGASGSGSGPEGSGGGRGSGIRRGGGSEEGGTDGGSTSPRPVSGSGPGSGSPSIAQIERDKVQARADEAQDENLIDAFGTLTIASNGETTFLGKTARAEYLIYAPHTLPPAKSAYSSPVVDPFTPCSIFPNSFGMGARLLDMSETPEDEDALAREIWARLPTWDDALALCEVYMAHGKYSWSTLPRAELCGLYLSGVYAHPPEARSAQRTCWAALSLLFTVFALGALFEPPSSTSSSSPSSPSTQGIHPSASAYFRTARAALALEQPALRTTATCVLTLVHLAQWLEHAQAYGEVVSGGDVGVRNVPGDGIQSKSKGVGGASGWVWAYMGIAVRLGTSVRFPSRSHRRVAIALLSNCIDWAAFVPTLAIPYLPSLMYMPRFEQCKVEA
ncbi:hypothetical protein HWV62_1757 [Athelia sp. TMB]|nr:hypothetical protein HWV62_1757 [Athelia sp. TMB]